MQQLKITQCVTERNKTVDGYLRDISRIPMITTEEETELASRIQRGDESARQELVQANLRFVVSVAKQYQGRGLELSDLINEGNLGLMKAASRFDPTRGFKFISYAVWWIRQNILQGIAEQGRMVRLPLNQLGVINRIYRTKEEFLQKNEREPTDSELAEFMDITPEKIVEAKCISCRYLSFDTPFEDDGDGTLLDVVPDRESPQADDSLGRESLQSDLRDVMIALSDRERQIVSLAFGLGCQEMTLEEIGERYHLTRERVRQVKEKAIRKLSRPSVKARLVQYR